MITRGLLRLKNKGRIANILKLEKINLKNKVIPLKQTVFPFKTKFKITQNLQRNFSIYDYIPNIWPFSSNPKNPDQSEPHQNDSNSSSNSQGKIEDIPVYTLYKDERDEEYISDNDFQIRIKSFSWQMVKRYYRKIIYIFWKAWIEDNLEYIILIILFFLI